MGFDGSAWNKLCALRNALLYPPSLCLFGDGSAEQLLICAQKEVKSYCFAQNEWISLPSMHRFHCQGGIAYDAMNERVYVGGGLDTKHTFSYLDLSQQVWLNIADTKYEHTQYPAIWCNEFASNNIVYIAGNSRTDLGVVEFIDLRAGNVGWQVAPNEMQLNACIESPQVVRDQMGCRHRYSDGYPMQIKRIFV